MDEKPHYLLPGYIKRVLRRVRRRYELEVSNVTVGPEFVELSIGFRKKPKNTNALIDALRLTLRNI